MAEPSTTPELDRETIAALEADRETIDPSYARALDEWVASGFEPEHDPRARPGSSPRRGGLAARAGMAWRRGPGRLAARLGELAPRALAGPRRAPLALATASCVLLVVVVVAVATDPGSRPGTDAVIATEELPAGGGDDPVEAGLAQEGPSTLEGSQPQARQADPRSSRGGEAAIDRDAAPAPPLLPVPPAGPGSDLAPGQAERQIRRDASIRLGTERDDVGRVADEAITVADRNGAIVTSSRLSESEERSIASIELAVPVGSLSGVLAELSELGRVVSRNEGSLDVTGTAVRLRERIADLRARARSTRAQLEQTADGAEADRLERRLSRLNRSLERLRGQRDGLSQETRFAQVSVAVTDEGGSRSGLGGALDDAISVLESIAGAAIIVAAALLPFLALLGAAWFATARIRRRGRERALDRSG